MDAIKDKVQEKVNQIYRRDGEVKPSVLVEEARLKSSPIHDAFEWNDKKAGNEYRLMQARNWIRKVEIIIEDRPERFVHIPKVEFSEGSEGSYKPISIVTKDDDEYRLAMNETLSKFNAARSAYEELKKAAARTKKKKPNFKKADKGFEMVDSALSAGGR